MCCHILPVHEIAKPANSWCPHCPTRQSCAIYDSRPEECRRFDCGWLTSASIGDEWQPRRSRIVLEAEVNGHRMTAMVHPDQPEAWRQSPYYEQLKAWSRAAVPHHGQVVVKTGSRCTVVLPDRDVDLGEVGPDEMIVNAITNSPNGPLLEPMKLPRDDPRAANLG